MDERKLNAIDFIAEAFKKLGLKFNVNKTQEHTELAAWASINGGPLLQVRYILVGDHNDVAVCILGVFTEVPVKKRSRILELCNALNCEFRFLKFILNEKGDVHVTYDFPQNCPDECIGDMAIDIGVIMFEVLNKKYKQFVKAIYLDEE